MVGRDWFLGSYCTISTPYEVDSCRGDVMDIEWGVAIGVVGIGLTIYFGLRARAVVRRKKSQKQVARDNSTAIQSGRDTNIQSGRDTNMGKE